METITITFNHTSLEESELLVLGGINPETADMAFQLEGPEPKVSIGYFKSLAEIYPEYHKPCWSADKLRVMIDNFGYKGNRIIDDTRLVPTLLSLQTIKDIKEHKIGV